VVAAVFGVWASGAFCIVIGGRVLGIDVGGFWAQFFKQSKIHLYCY
jgi:hypothetical protein